RRVDLVPPDSSGSRYRRGRDAHAALRPLRLRLAGRPYPLPGVRGGGSGEIAVLHRSAAYRGADRGMRELQGVREVDRPQPGCAAGAGDRRSDVAVDGSVVDGARLRKDGAGAGGAVAGSRLIVRVRPAWEPCRMTNARVLAGRLADLLSRGGPSTVDNIRLLCRLHNDVAARSAFGDEFMNPFTRGFAYDGPSPLEPRGAKEVSAGRRATRGSPPSPSGDSRPRRRAIRNEST